MFKIKKTSGWILSKSQVQAINTRIIFKKPNSLKTNPGGCAVEGVGLRLLAWEFESRQGHGCLSLESVVCRQAQSATCLSLDRGDLPSVVCLSMISKHPQWADTH
jgi:hypothetical protein